MTVQDTIREMLCRWREAQDPAFAPGHFGDSGGSGIGMPATWNDSYRLLERLLRDLREGAYRREHTHLVARYRDAPVVRMTRLPMRRDGKGQPVIQVPRYCDLVAGAPSVMDPKVADALVRDARRVVFERTARGAYRATHPDVKAVDRGLELVEERWFRVSKQPPFLPVGFVAEAKVAA